MAATRRRARGGGHGSMSAKKYRKSLRRLEQSIRNADIAAQAAFNAKRMSRRKGMSINSNAMNVGKNLRRSSRRTIQSAAMKSIRQRAREEQQKSIKKMAESYKEAVKAAKAAQKAQTEAELDDLMSRFGF
jgi:hypothetical protein